MMLRPWCHNMIMTILSDQSCHVFFHCWLAGQAEECVPFSTSTFFPESPCSLSFILSFWRWFMTGNVFRLAEPDPPIRLEKMEETTNKISLALEIQEEGLSTKPGRCFCCLFQQVAHLHRLIYEMNVLLERDCSLVFHYVRCDWNINEDANLDVDSEKGNWSLSFWARGYQHMVSAVDNVE